MKIIIIAMLILFLSACDTKEKEITTIEIDWTTGTTDTLRGENGFIIWSRNDTIRIAKQERISKPTTIPPESFNYIRINWVDIDE